MSKRINLRADKKKLTRIQKNVAQYEDNPIGGSGSLNIMGISHDELCCRTCAKAATRFSVIRRRYDVNPFRVKPRMVKEVVIGFFCNDCAGDVDELAIAGEPIE